MSLKSDVDKVFILSFREKAVNSLCIHSCDASYWPLSGVYFNSTTQFEVVEKVEHLNLLMASNVEIVLVISEEFI